MRNGVYYGRCRFVETSVPMICFGTFHTTATGFGKLYGLQGGLMECMRNLTRCLVVVDHLVGEGYRTRPIVLL
eukprot:scaffold3240_cov187-Amphora_coffeaeformis.AAC.10